MNTTKMIVKMLFLSTSQWHSEVSFNLPTISLQMTTAKGIEQYYIVILNILNGILYQANLLQLFTSRITRVNQQTLTWLAGSSFLSETGNGLLDTARSASYKVMTNHCHCFGRELLQRHCTRLPTSIFQLSGLQAVCVWLVFFKIWTCLFVDP